MLHICAVLQNLIFVCPLFLALLLLLLLLPLLDLHQQVRPVAEAKLVGLLEQVGWPSCLSANSVKALNVTEVTELKKEPV